MNTSIYEYIIAIAEERSIARAAERFYLAQSVLSHHLKTIEASIGTPLFVRSSKGMQLTRAGVLFINNAKLILHKEDEMKKRLLSLRYEQKASFSIAVTDTCSKFFMQTVLPALWAISSEFRPNVTIGSSVSVQQALTDNNADIGVFYLINPLAQELIASPLYSSSWVIVSPAGNPISPTSKGIQTALQDEIFPVFHTAEKTSRFIENKFWGNLHINPPFIIEAMTRETVMDMISNKRAFGFSIDSATDIYQNAGLEISESFCTLQCVISYRKDLFFDKIGKEAIDIIIQLLR